ncbi:hypothetical protein [Nautilia sp.]
MNLLYWHMMCVFGWAVFIVSLAKSLECGEYPKFVSFLSLFFMAAVLLIGTKLMLNFPEVAKSGMWIHVKLSIDIIAMILNIYLVYIVMKRKIVKKTTAAAIFWITVLMFGLMYYLTLFKPF